MARSGWPFCSAGADESMLSWKVYVSLECASRVDPCRGPGYPSMSSPLAVSPVNGTAENGPLEPFVEYDRWSWLLSTVAVVPSPGKKAKSIRALGTASSDGLSSVMVNVVGVVPAGSEDGKVAWMVVAWPWVLPW